MNSRLQVQLNMVGACITVAQSSDYKPAWNGKPPADFGTDIVQLATDYGAATGGGGDAKSAAETALEDATFVLARALANHFKKAGVLDRLGKVDVSKSEIMKLRTQDQVNQTTAIRDLVTAAISGFSNVMSRARGQIVNRSALLKEVETDPAALVESVNDLDDLALQFDSTDAGKRFAEAWKRARIIVDTGGGHTPPAPPASTPPPA